jgi:glyoxylase-like metal-dependent hydrolase (beta-lactamase superfamily II)/rhodanese-related sulfurtransferase
VTAAAEDDMILEQHDLGCLAQASYLIADPRSRTAAVVDPRRDVDVYVDRARELGVEIRHVFLTHFHADFLAGHLELRERTGAVLHLGRRAEADYAFVPVGEGDRIAFGDVRLEFLETPGHTPESVSILVFDQAQSPDRPQAVLTGDTLFIGDVGRPDLMASVGVTAEELARSLYRSLHVKLLKLPDETIVYPGHGAGSMCGKNLSKETSSTIGAQRAHNYALQPMPEEAFVRMVTSDQPEAPEYFAYDALLNRQERATLEEVLERSVRPLALDAVLRLENQGAQVLDTRDADAFATGHLAGSIQIGLGGSYATWAGTLLDREAPIVLVAAEGTERESALRLGRIGFDRVAGYLEGGFGALRARPDLVRRAERVLPEELARRLAAPNAPLVVDVRTDGEREAAHIPGSLHVRLPRLERELARIPRDRPLITVCAGGYRSATAASLLRRHGFDPVADLTGGMKAWEAAELATTASPPA